MTSSTLAIIGASLAGGRAAESLRARGYGGRVLLIGEESHAPYERPPLSKAFLGGGARIESILLRPTWDDIDVELVTGDRVVEISASQRTVAMASGRTEQVDKVLIATGGRSRRIDLPGADLAGIHYLREVGDADALAAELLPGVNLVVIGGGFIGLEVAATARQLGCEVTVIEGASVPLARRLGPAWGTFIAEAHVARGVRIGAGVGVAAFVGVGRVSEVELQDGTRLPADVVVVGIGMIPRVELAEQLGLSIVGGGIVVDDGARTSHEAVFAAGDVTMQPGWRSMRLERHESFQNAQDQGAVAAASMLGHVAEERETPWFWSDQYDLNIQAAGDLASPHTAVVRGDPASLSFAEFHVDQGRVIGVFAVNRQKDVRAAMKLIHSAQPVATAELSDESVDLRRLTRLMAMR